MEIFWKITLQKLVYAKVAYVYNLYKYITYL